MMNRTINRVRDPISTPARRRRIIADHARAALRLAYIQACNNVYMIRRNNKASKVIQGAYRRYKAYQCLLRLRKERWSRCAIRIQCKWRQVSAKKVRYNLYKDHRIKLATILVAMPSQRIWRGRQARREYALLKQRERERIERMKLNSALTIQSTIRRMLARMAYTKKKRTLQAYNELRYTAAAKIQRAWRLFFAKIRAERLRQRRFQSTIRIFGCVCLHHYRSRIKRENQRRRQRQIFVASCIINRSFKCWLARRKSKQLQAIRDELLHREKANITDIPPQVNDSKILEMKCSISRSLFSRMMQNNGPSFILSWCAKNHILSIDQSQISLGFVLQRILDATVHASKSISEHDYHDKLTLSGNIIADGDDQVPPIRHPEDTEKILRIKVDDMEADSRARLQSSPRLIENEDIDFTSFSHDVLDTETEERLSIQLTRPSPLSQQASPWRCIRNMLYWDKADDANAIRLTNDLIDLSMSRVGQSHTLSEPSQNHTNMDEGSHGLISLFIYQRPKYSEESDSAVGIQLVISGDDNDENDLQTNHPLQFALKDILVEIYNGQLPSKQNTPVPNSDMAGHNLSPIFKSSSSSSGISAGTFTRWQSSSIPSNIIASQDVLADEPNESEYGAVNDNGLRKPNIERPQTAKLRVVFEMDEIIPIQESQLEPEIESIVLPDYEAMASRIQRAFRRCAQYYRNKALYLESVYCRYRIYMKWKRIVPEMIRVIQTAATSIQRVYRGYQASRLVESIRNHACSHLLHEIRDMSYKEAVNQMSNPEMSQGSSEHSIRHDDYGDINNYGDISGEYSIMKDAHFSASINILNSLGLGRLPVGCIDLQKY